MGISKTEFTDKASLENLVDTETAELQRYVSEKMALRYRETMLQALTDLATPRSAAKAFVKTTVAAAVGGVCVASGAEMILGLGTAAGSVLFELGAKTAMVSPVFGGVAIALTDGQNQKQYRELLKEIIRSHRRTEQMRKGVVPELGLTT